MVEESVVSAVLIEKGMKPGWFFWQKVNVTLYDGQNYGQIKYCLALE